MKTIIKAQLQNMAQEELKAIIDKETLEKISQSDKSPLFKAYCIGHEGEATSTMVNHGNVVVQYFKDAISQVVDKLKIGTKFFLGHNADNSTQGRESVAEVVGKTLKDIGGKLHAIAVAYIKPEFRNQKLDVASFEGDVELAVSSDGCRAINIENISGVALGNSDFAKPAFVGATLLATVQNFSKNQGDKMTLDELKAKIKELGFSIDQLFSDVEITQTEAAKKLAQTNYEHAKRLETKLGEVKGELLKAQQEKQSLEDTIGKSNQELNKFKVGEVLAKSIATRKLNEQQQKFINKQVGLFESKKDGEELLKDVESFVDKQLDEYKSYAEILGIKVDDKTEGKDKSTGPADGKGGKDAEDLTLPENNDFIPA